MNHKNPKVLVIIGVSGAGKSSLAEKLLSDKTITLKLIPKYTTRPRRQSELGSFSEDIFVSKAEFTKLKQSGFFIDTIQPFSLPYWYGLPWPEPLNPDEFYLAILREFVLDQFLEHFPESVIYQLKVDPKTAEKRMVGRGQNPSDIKARMSSLVNEQLRSLKRAKKTFQNDGDLNQLATTIIENFRSDIK